MTSPSLAVQLGLSVRADDGVGLKTDVQRPAGASRGPAVLLRTPYGTGSLPMLRFARVLAGLGWAVVFQNVRGRYGSEGSFEPFVHERQDGAATLRWICEQPWSDGRVLLLGISYSTYTAAALVGAHEPAELLGMVSLVSMTRPWAHFFEGGAFRLHWALAWAQLIAGPRQEPLDLAAMRRCAHRPLAELPELLGFPPRPWHDWWTCPDPDAPTWRETEVDRHLLAHPLPMLHVGGWYDFSLPSTLDLYQRFTASDAASQQLVLGPWEHNAVFDLLLRGLLAPAPESDARRLATTFSGFLAACREGAPAPGPAVQVWRGEGSGGTWLEFDSAWPPPHPPWSLPLGEAVAGSGSLAWTASAPSEHDFALPIGGRAWAAAGWSSAGVCAGSAVAAGTVSWLSPPLRRALEVAGRCRLSLVLADDGAAEGAPVDYAARLFDLDPGGTAHWVADAILRVEPPRGPVAVLDFGLLCWLFRVDHRLRLDLAGHRFPIFDAPSGSRRRHVRLDEEASRLELAAVIGIDGVEKER